MNTVYFDKDGTVATDGHKLIKVSYPDIPDKDFPAIKQLSPEEKNVKKEPFLISKNSAMDLQKNLSKHSTLPILNGTTRLDWSKSNSNGEAYFGLTNLETTCVKVIKKIDEEFPKYQNAVPTEKPSFKISVDPNYMIELCQQFKSAGIGCIDMEFIAKDKPFFLRGKVVDAHQTLTAILMPLENIEEKEKPNEPDEEPYGSYEPEEGKVKNRQKADKNTPKTSEKEKPVGLSTGRETTLKNKGKTTEKDKNTPKTDKNASKKDTKNVLTNSFHKTQIEVNKSSEELDKIALDIRKGKACLGHKVYAAKIRKALCGFKGCTHCDELGRKK